MDADVLIALGAVAFLAVWGGVAEVLAYRYRRRLEQRLGEIEADFLEERVDRP